MKIFARGLASILLCAIGFGAEAQTVLSGTNPTIIYGGRYILGNAVYTVTINASHVDLDLQGFDVSEASGSCPLINGGNAPGCSGVAPAVRQVGIKATGVDITIHNGRIMGHAGDGIVITAPSPGAFLDVQLRDLTVNNNLGYGIAIFGTGATLSNIRAYQNALDGVLLPNQVRLEHVTASYNNGSGINGATGTGNYYDVMVTHNKTFGIIANGTMDKIDAQSNGGQGMDVSGTLRDSNAEFNGSDGISASPRGVVIDSTSSQNGGAGFTLGTSICYRNLSANGNTGAAVSGGTPLAGAQAYCN
jgi:hypothetical protein